MLVRQGNDYLRAMWFNQPFMREKFREGQHVLLSGKPRHKGGRWEMSHPRVTWLDGADDQPEMRLLPLYPLTEGLTQYQVRRMVGERARTLRPCSGRSVFRITCCKQYDLMPLAEALPAIHSPQDAEQLERARRRFVFQELFILQLAVVARRWQQQVGFRAPALAATADINARIERLFPFEWTAGQRAAIDEVAADLAQRNADEPPAARRRRQRQNGRRRVRDARVRCPRPSGGADGADRNPGPPTCGHAGQPAQSQPRAVLCCSSAA